MSPNKGGGSCGVSASEYRAMHNGGKINFGDPTAYLTYDIKCGKLVDVNNTPIASLYRNQSIHANSIQ